MCPRVLARGVDRQHAGSAGRAAGPRGGGLSASAVARLKGCWTEEYRLWRRSKLGRDRWVYLWVEGIYSGLRADEAPVRAGSDRRERARPEEAPRDRGRGARIQAELARGAAGTQGPGPHHPATPGGRRRRARLLGGRPQDLPRHPASAVLGDKTANVRLTGGEPAFDVGLAA